MKSALLERARARHQSPSEFVRAALADAIGAPEHCRDDQAPTSSRSTAADRVRLSLRMSRCEALATIAAARSAGLAPGAFVAGLVAGIPALTSGHSSEEHLAALVASNAQMSTLTRHLGRLASLSGQGPVQAAQERQPLDQVVHQVRQHLDLVGGVLADLKPRRAGPAGQPAGRHL